MKNPKNLYKTGFKNLGSNALFSHNNDPFEAR